MRRAPLVDALVAAAATGAVVATIATATAAHAGAAPTVAPELRPLWSSQRGTLGAPTGSPYAIPGATVQDFRGGKMYRGANGQVIALSTAELDGFTPANGAVAYALDQQGDAYVFGAEGPTRWDCSSLTQKAYAFAGQKLPRTSARQADALPRVSEPQPGDLLWWPGHVGIYLGTKDGRHMMVNATWHRYGGVVRKGVLIVDPSTRADSPAFEAHRNPLR